MIGEHWHRMFVGGQWQQSHSPSRIDLIDPATESWVASVSDGDGEDVARATAAAQQAAPAWASTPPSERAELLTAFANGYDLRREEIARLVTAQNGAVLSRSRRTNGTRPVAMYHHYAEVARSFRNEETAAQDQGILRREPVGVVGIIIPWNAPQSLLAHKLGPALAAGCTVVIKPAAETPLDSLLIGELATKVGFPPGVVNVVTGGRATGSALVASPQVDMVSFTGSTAAGRAIAAQCGQSLKPVVAELGGKSAAVILDDADPNHFADTLIATCLPNTGQVCYACTRVIVPRPQYQQWLDVVIATLSNSTVGDPHNPDTVFGPLVSATQRERVEAYIASAREEGATVALGGGRPSGLTTGYFVEPTVLVDVAPTMRVFREEIFGPVIVVVPHDGDSDAVRIANDSSYGLGGAVYSRDIDRATDVARRIQSGNISINGRERSISAPSHGFKDSGIGGNPGLEAHVQLKFVAGGRRRSPQV